MASDPAGARRVYLQPRSEDYRPFHRRNSPTRWRGEPCETFICLFETMPFGGTGFAGMGHYYGKYGFDALSHAKSMLISPPDVAIDHLYSPFNDAKIRRSKGGSNTRRCSAAVCCRLAYSTERLL